MGPGTILVAAVAFGVIVLISKSIRVVQQAQTMIIERLGRYHKTLGSGINFVLPVIDRPRSVDWHQTIITPAGDSYSRRFRTERIDLRETVYVFPRQNVITKDNVVVEIDALIYSQITDPVRATYEIANLPDAIEKLTQTTLRNVIGEMELDHVLSSRDTINAKLREILDEATHKWGAKVSRVELKDINPPRDIRDAMEKQMRAERDRRAAILTAEAGKTAARRSRSARICFSIASRMSRGGLMSLSSTRLTFAPHLCVASSRISRSLALMVSREESTWSSSISPITFRSVVCVSFSIASGRLAIS